MVLTKTVMKVTMNERGLHLFAFNSGSRSFLRASAWSLKVGLPVVERKKVGTEDPACLARRHFTPSSIQFFLFFPRVQNESSWRGNQH